MRYAFCLFNYYPFGGLSRDFIAIAKACLAQGHTVDVYTQSWHAPLPTNLQINIIPRQGYTNHKRNFNFAKHLQSVLEKNHYDAVIGFNRMPGLDVYYTADLCFQAASRSKHGCFYRLSSRYRYYHFLEQSVFANNKTQILLINDNEREVYKHFYGTDDKYFHTVPPGIERERLLQNKMAVSDTTIRQQLNLSKEDHFILAVGSSFNTKGFDRAIYALAALPNSIRAKSRLVIIGKGKTQSLIKLAKKLGVHPQIHFLGTCDHIGAYMHAADLLIHPARHETAGNVLLEALVCGLPVLVTENCGYAKHIADAQAGLVVPSLFQQGALNQMLLTMLTDGKQPQRQQNALAYTATTDLYSLPERAAQIIEQVARQKVFAI